MTADQKKQWGGFEKELTAKMDKLLTPEQKEELKKPPQGRPGGPMNFPQPGQIMSLTQQGSLKLTPEQRKQLRDLQKEADTKLDSLFTADQKKQFKDMHPPRPHRRSGRRRSSGRHRQCVFPCLSLRSGPPRAGRQGFTPGKLLEELQPKEAAKKPAAQ